MNELSFVRLLRNYLSYHQGWRNLFCLTAVCPGFSVICILRFARMNDFPVIGDLVTRTGLWDRQGANIAGRYKEMYGLELFLR